MNTLPVAPQPWCLVLFVSFESREVGDVFAVGFREGATLAWHLACHMQLRAIAPVHGTPLPGSQRAGFLSRQQSLKENP